METAGTSASTGASTTRHLTLQCQFCQTWNRIDASRAADRPLCGKCGKPMLLDRPVKLTDESFQRTIAESEVPVLVDFYADWCGPCKMMAPAVDQLASAWTGRALVAKLDTDANPRTAQHFQIRGIPTVMVFQQGKVMANQSGALPYQMLEQFLTKVSERPAG
jgi:thioredoxin 2